MAFGAADPRVYGRPSPVRGRRAPLGRREIPPQEPVRAEAGETPGYEFGGSGGRGTRRDTGGFGTGGFDTGGFSTGGFSTGGFGTGGFGAGDFGDAGATDFPGQGTGPRRTPAAIPPDAFDGRPDSGSFRAVRDSDQFPRVRDSGPFRAPRDGLRPPRPGNRGGSYPTPTGPYRAPGTDGFPRVQDAPRTRDVPRDLPRGLPRGQDPYASPGTRDSGAFRQLPPPPQSPQHPRPQGGSGGFPAARNPSGGFPAAGGSGGFPAAGGSGGFPAAPGSGGFPAVPGSGPFPAAPGSRPGTRPGTRQGTGPDGGPGRGPGSGGFPAAPNTDGFPAGRNTGGFRPPRDSASFPAAPGGRNSGALPAAPPGRNSGPFPAAGNFPGTGNTGGFRAAPNAQTPNAQTPNTQGSRPAPAQPRRLLNLRYTPTISSSGTVGPVPPPEEFTGPRPRLGSGFGREDRARQGGADDQPSRWSRPPTRGASRRVTTPRDDRDDRGDRDEIVSRRKPGSRWDGDALDGKRGEESIRHLKNQGAEEEDPSTLSRIAAQVLTVVRSRNWLTGLVIPIVAAMAVGVVVVIIAGANNGNGHVPSSLSAGFPPARDAAVDFTDTPSLAGRGVDQQLSQVAVSGTTAVAVGAQTGTSVPRPRFFVSADSGKTWQLATVSGTSAPGGAPTLVAGGGQGWVALSSTSVFTSANGKSWVPESPLPEVQGDKITVLIATGSGFLAAGSSAGSGTNQASPVVWLSSNGKAWQRISGAQLGLTSDAGRVLGITSAASNGGTAVIAAAVQGGGSATWASTNGGTTWTPVTVPAGTDDSASIAGLATLGKGFVAVRATPPNGSADVFTSANGMTWRQSATVATADGAALTLGLVSGGPTGAVITGQADGFQIAFISANGTAWTGTNPVNTTASEHVTGAALNGNGQAVIAGTSAGNAAEQQPVLTVVGTQGDPDQIDVRAIPGATVPEIGVGAIATSGATEVAAGSADGFPALWTSSDGGVNWARATASTSGALSPGGDDQLTGVAHGDDGWVAVGGPVPAASNTGGAHPVVVTSANGQSWTAANSETDFQSPGSVTSAVTARQSAYVIVGRESIGGRTIAAAWYSVGLTSWQSGADAKPGALDGSGNRQMNAVAATNKGFAAVGSAGGHPAAWQSATGRTWSETTLPVPAGAASATLRYAAANGNTVAAIGTATTAGGKALPFAAVSADGGTTWTETLLPTPKGSGAPATGATSPVTALTAAGGGFTATGTYGAPGAQDVVVWLLDPGASPHATWTMATPAGTGLAGSGTQAITALTSTGATLTGAGFTATSTTEEPTLWQSPVRS